jgi:protein-L-isoaspartate(D-aspartate) O-methyltransferase
MTDSTQQRINMVESQVRPSDVTDRRIIRAMLAVPREAFVPASLQALAYMDEAVPAAEGAGAPERCLLAPRTFAKLVQLAGIGSGEAVLDVGCCTGYSTAVLAQLARTVLAVEVEAALAAAAKRILRQQSVNNAIVLDGPLEQGAPSHAPFDAILVNGSVTRVPDALLAQLRDGGRLVAIFAEGGVGRATVWQRTGSVFDARPVFDAAAPLLPGFAPSAEFVL